MGSRNSLGAEVESFVMSGFLFVVALFEEEGHTCCCYCSDQKTDAECIICFGCSISPPQSGRRRHYLFPGTTKAVSLDQQQELLPSTNCCCSTTTATEKAESFYQQEDDSFLFVLGGDASNNNNNGFCCERPDEWPVCATSYAPYGGTKRRTI